MAGEHSFTCRKSAVIQPFTQGKPDRDMPLENYQVTGISERPEAHLRGHPRSRSGEPDDFHTFDGVRPR
ncbi:MAG: hypothetical protein JWO93_3371 [Micrococcaceae bacterium]|nr:hypothetical protein [Micrococcaceae bacterium]